MKTTLGHALLVAALFSPAAGAGEPLDPMAAGLTPSERMDVLVERVKEAQAEAKTLRADFVQLKESELLLEPEESTGRFYYQSPDRVRWEYLEPNPIVVVIRGEEMTSYFQDLGRAEIYSIGRYSERVFEYLGATGSLETLKKYFSLTADFPEAAGQPYHLVLSPSYPRIKRRLSGMEIWIDPELFLPSRLKYVEPNGDTTEYRFDDLEPNDELDDDLFEVALPPETEIKTVELGRG